MCAGSARTWTSYGKGWRRWRRCGLTWGYVVDRSGQESADAQSEVPARRLSPSRLGQVSGRHCAARPELRYGSYHPNRAVLIRLTQGHKCKRRTETSEQKRTDSRAYVRRSPYPGWAGTRHVDVLPGAHWHLRSSVCISQFGLSRMLPYRRSLLIEIRPSRRHCDLP